MNWFEADNGFLVNLEKVKAIQKNEDNSSVIYFHLGDVLESVTCSMPYETLKSILQYRSKKSEDISSSLRTIAHGSFTPVP